MEPRTHNNGVISLRIILFDSFVNLQRSLQVFGVEPAADGHHGYRRFDMSQILRHVLRLPVVVIVAVLHPLVPNFNLVVEVLVIDVRQWSQIQKELISVRSTGIEKGRWLRCGSGARLAKEGTEDKCILDIKCPVVM